MKKKWILLVLILATMLAYQKNAFAQTRSREVYEKKGHVIWDVRTTEKVVAITFDDGPHPIFTPQILDILAKYDAKATFFVAGNKVKRFPDVLKRQVREGHEIANHTYNHIYSSRITAAKLTEELTQTDQLIQQLSGYKTTLYRPVGGLYNDTIIDTAVKNGKTVVLWSWHQDPRDWKSPPASQITRHITKGIQPGNIILLHDWNGHEDSPVSQSVKAFDQIMKFLYDNDYRCVTVSELLQISQNKKPNPYNIPSFQ
ncbi:MULTISPECIES: polysaccharide deacetylase family protein [Bacillus]|uniref:polysaccharide deacetylase family protein n=1 Tax=Bacillus TaxID=1386 RepID=UPI0002E91A24|nr:MULTISPECIES: polysaccharide deacetylase family protein [Bacillus]